jgi:hypothetical protein
MNSNKKITAIPKYMIRSIEFFSYLSSCSAQVASSVVTYLGIGNREYHGLSLHQGMPLSSGFSVPHSMASALTSLFLDFILFS